MVCDSSSTSGITGAQKKLHIYYKADRRKSLPGKLGVIGLKKKKQGEGIKDERKVSILMIILHYLQKKNR